MAKPRRPVPVRGQELHHCTGLGNAIRGALGEIEKRWLAQVEADVADRTDVHLTQLRDGIPHYLAALADLLALGDGGFDERATESWAKVAREHGITRVRIGFDIDQLVHEFLVLRRVIRDFAVEKGVSNERATEAVADLIDAAIAESVRAYVETRDHEARRVQAENIGFLTHELRNPLSAAIQAVELLRIGSEEQRQRALQALDRSHSRLLALINSVLETERLESRAAEPRIVEVRIGDLLDASTQVARKAAHDRGLAFEVRGDLDQRIQLDPELTRSALQNIVDNAVKYTDDGSVEVIIERDATWLTILVCDTGPGLSPEELRTIFEPFRRGATAKQGTGLGLAIARRAIEAQGGSIRAESPGTGCKFTITLPAR